MKKKTAKSAQSIEAIAPLTEFLAVDLEVISRSKLDTLIEALGTKVIVNRNEKLKQDHVILLSLGGIKPSSYEPEAYINSVIQKIVKVVAKLPQAPRKQWDQAKTRTFDIGIQAGTHPPIFELRLDKRTIDALARVGGRIQVTVYGAAIGAEVEV